MFTCKRHCRFFYMRIVMYHALGNMHDVFCSCRPLGICRIDAVLRYQMTTE